MMNYKDFLDGMCIVIPSWDNYEILEECIKSIYTYSAFSHEICVHLNAYKSLDKIKELQKKFPFKYTYSETNLGVSRAVNLASTLCTKKIIMFFNDDMVALPGWDTELVSFIKEKELPILTWISSTMIEPTGKSNCTMAPFYYGRSPGEFDRNRLLKDLPLIRDKARNVQGTTWPPNLMYKEVWDKIGGFSEEYFPGFGSDPDLAKKMWDIGCRTYIGVGKSLVYHFQCVTTKKVNHLNNGKEIFKKIHNIEIEDFVTNYLRRGNAL